MEPKITKYVEIGMWIILRDSLPSDHLESTYQQLILQGFIPEDYGYIYKSYKDIRD